MLPFLKQKPMATGLIVQTRKADGDAKPMEDDSDAAMEACASDIMRAIESKDHRGLAKAIRSAMECHMSGDDESYDSQNQKAVAFEKGE